MLIWAIIATIVSVITVSIFIAYRRQVKNTCRHLAFMKKNKTNLRLRSGLPFRELYELSDNVNELLDNSDELRHKAEHNEQNLKDAITNISHDIRTPLTSLDGFFQLLKNADSEEERTQCVDVIQNRINNLKYMLEELFTYTKLQNEDYKLQTEPIDIVRCVSSTLVSFYNEFQEKGIEVQVDFTDEEIVVDCNAEGLQRIVQNVLKNVIDHGSKTVEMTLKQENERVIFSCSNKVDNPDSIDISQIFTRFYKSDPARTHSSTGLGLAIAKGLAERMNGDMTAEVQGEWFKVEIRFKKFEIY
ncbi:MAG: HAMP domain-containing histidine kinase [Oscillospiraceae bacterium]|nr:HAMP domain-containing histidine kinase [Oscillospiraceae bacterium]